MGLGGCTAIDVTLILKKQRQPVADCWIELSAQHIASLPKVFTAIHITSLVRGEGLNPKQVERAVHLSANKCCSDSQMLRDAVTLTHSFEIVACTTSAGLEA